MAFTVRNPIGLVLLVWVLMLANAAMAYEGDGVVESGEKEAEELSRAAQNSMADLMSFPVQTKPGMGWFVYLRLYRSEKASFEKTWVPGDPEELQ